MSAAERVARGAALLDEKRPGWAERIDLSVLALDNACRCPLGQVFAPDDPDDGPGYWDGIDTLGIRDGDAGWFGFNLDDDRRRPSKQWAELDELWIAEIRRRTAVTA